MLELPLYDASFSAAGRNQASVDRKSHVGHVGRVTNEVEGALRRPINWILVQLHLQK